MRFMVPLWHPLAALASPAGGLANEARGFGEWQARVSALLFRLNLELLHGT